MDEDKTNPQTQEGEEVDKSATEPVTPEPKEPEAQPETPEPEEEPAEEPDAEEEPEEPEEEEPAPSPRENKRIKQLTQKLAERGQPPLTPQQQQAIDAGEYTTEELNQRLQEYGQQQYQAALAQSQQIGMFHTRLEIDAPRVAQKYEVLDQSSDNFDPGVAALINEKYLRIVGYDDRTGMVQRPDIRYEEFVDTEFELASALNSTTKADSTRNLARQAARTGVRPNSVTKKPYQGDDPRQMSDEQLTQAINSGLGIKPR